MATPLCKLFFHFTGKHQVDYDAEDICGHSSYSMNFFTLDCFTCLELVDYTDGINSYLLVEANFCVQRLKKSFQNILLHVVMFKTILLVIFGIITGLKIC